MPLTSTNEPDSLHLGQYAERAYLEYAMSVVKGRALPEVADGQKPVQRRILFAMHEMGLAAGAKPVKSARVVGEILGKYHPHGDSSAYEAMVRMAQEFTLRYPLIDGIGNFGSRDGDGAAAMRYTEARLTPLASLLLSELNQGTVDFIPNYDGAFNEPTYLPARLPMVLLNGASGIAVGMATEIPSHNLHEVTNAAIALLKKPSMTVSELMEHIQGPDFAGGAHIISTPEDIEHTYTSGKGSVRVRARYEIEKLARGQWRAIVSELPPGVGAQKILAEIEEQTNPKLKNGKKKLTQEQINQKELLLSQLEYVRDESDSACPVRLVFEPKSSRIDSEELMNTLLAQTSLEINVSINLVMMGMDGRPAQKNLLEIISEWLQFRVHTVTRRLQHRLGQVEKRIHILEGRMVVFLNIDEVIAVIRESDEPKQDLMARFHLSEVQAEDILEIRLRQLARLEGIKLEQELSKLQEERQQLQHILGDENVKRKLIISEMKADAKQFGDERRTLIQAASRASLTQTMVDEPITLIVSEKGWIRARSGHHLDLSQTSFKEGDALAQVIETRTVWPILLLDNQGRIYNMDAAELPSGRGDGVPLGSLVDLQNSAMPVCVISDTPESQYLLSNSGGYGFISSLKDLLSRGRSGKACLTLHDDETPLAAVACDQQTTVVLASRNSRLLAYPLSEIKNMSKGRGLQLIALEGDDVLQQCHSTNADKITVHSQGKRGGQHQDSIAISAITAKRGHKGKLFADNQLLITHLDS
ncbi:DNA topoisomerase IV subunit A [Vitreoscilla massiliensis]|uniref:DNA topoisomerase 4 subunit A n=1 Tax=Vitreoscilla massiliensis TaxID=1689272 RepID=A0ABY4DX26_9NEIS|nr:DNA topoisomerase IV subunit A [Vitreoscilla massiliensis]UOO87824.1 DNA topoisomerase IV subunit A [Vitreoscilla massiliensis]